jgi:hypothetical protein
MTDTVENRAVESVTKLNVWRVTYKRLIQWRGGDSDLSDSPIFDVRSNQKSLVVTVGRSLTDVEAELAKGGHRALLTECECITISDTGSPFYWAAMSGWQLCFLKSND